jgi:perosamine synthetase
MMPSHPTLRFSDIFPRHKQSLHAQHSPNELHLTYNARGALYQLLLSLPKEVRDVVLLPAFHCTALVEPVVRAGYHAVFYRVRPNFTIDLEDLRSKCSSRDALIVVVDFFGFPADLGPVVEMARANGSYVVEDCAHSFLSRTGSNHVGHRGDFALFSYYKFAPSLAGGGLGVNRTGFALRNPVGQAPLNARIVIGKRLIEQTAANSPQNPLSKLFLWLEEKRVARKRASEPSTSHLGAAVSAFVDDPYLWREDLARAGMPGLCRCILESCDWNMIAAARQDNYRMLSRMLRDTPAARPVLPDLPDSVVPWAFPVLLENRLQHEQELRRRGVPLFTFGETLHPALTAFHDRARQDAEDLSRQLLVLPVHANLSDADIAGYANVFCRYIEGIGMKAGPARAETEAARRQLVPASGGSRAVPTASTQIAVLRSPEEWDMLRSSWDEILSSQSRGIRDLDVSAGFDWAMTVWQTHLSSGPIELLVLRENGEISGILPVYRFTRSVGRIPCRSVAPVGDLYSGRTGFLLRTPNGAALDALFTHLREKLDPWDVLTLTLVRGSFHDRLFRGFASAHGFYIRAIEEQNSPYVQMQENWEQHFASLPKKFRSTIRNGEKRLRERGSLSYRECRSRQDAADFNAAVLDIEKDSWKAAAGTSIASNPVHEAFHRAITMRAAESGFFSGHLLLLDGQPVAYVMGLLYNCVFLDLKESYKNSLREASPGHVLKNFVFARLYEQKTKVYDFMGKCEEYKMKWTDKTYCRTTYLLFNDTLRGRAAHWLSMIAKASPNVTAPAGAGPSEREGRRTPETQAAYESKEEKRVNGDARL